MMRIITGRARGTRLDTLAGERTRPTAERTKEAVFSMLQFRMTDAAVLDLFSGSGQLALEALSRGAKSAVLCDSAKEAIDVIRRNAQKTRLDAQCRIVCSDYRSFLQNYQGDGFDIVFLDPPYALGAVPISLSFLIERGLLKESAIVVCETGAAEDVFAGDKSLEACFAIKRQTRYGAACVTVLERALEGGLTE